MHWIKVIKSYAKEFDTFHWNNDELFIKAEDWKWYDSYDIVMACDALWLFIEEIGEEEDAESKEHIDACFIRVGEETTDIDERFIGDGTELGYAYSGINEGS